MARTRKTVEIVRKKIKGRAYVENNGKPRNCQEYSAEQI
jgi:hypothetical protein